MSSRKNKQLSTPIPVQGYAEDCMRALMATTKKVQRFGQSKFAKHPQFSKLSGPRVGLLFKVQASGAIRMGDLAAHLMVAPRTLTDLVDALERDGFLRRIPDKSDRRAILIELAPEIKADFNEIAELRKQFLEETFSVLSAGEQLELIRLLEKVQHGPLSELTEGAEFVD